MINKTLAIKKTKQHYTLVEILVVIALMAILMGIGTASFNAATGKRGLRGGVSMVSSQVNLARSVAVSKNSYIALLLPEPFSGKTTSSNDDFKAFFCNQMRL
ncbi:MAG: prepilin-type N-terminal cleavage/methylation domain-containing protein, partial [Victivallaceae bacterium]|nr:prepilin-type N-terminal cleavage/methylation domain-containing protein [Victivallaceae bacterium]